MMTYFKESVEISTAELRRAAGRFVTGVSVVTAPDIDGVHKGATANAITCLSLEPPLYLACLTNTSNTLRAIEQTRVFGINILSNEQDRHATIFASKQLDKFATIPFETGILGVPLIKEAIATIECDVECTYAGGDHTIVVGRVRSLKECSDSPLVMCSGKFVNVLA
jgi:flavin reductase